MCYLVSFLHIPHGWCHSRGIIMSTVNMVPWKFLLAQVKKKHGMGTYSVTSRKSRNCENR